MSLRTLALAIPLLATFASVVACGDTEADPDGPSPAPTTTIPAPGPGPAPVPQCKAPTGPGTLHKGDVAENEVWTAEGSPHIVEYDVSVRNGAKLTIEPCAIVELEADRHLNVAYPITPNKGTLVAEGTAEKPIVFRGRAGAKWSSVHVNAPGTVRLAHVTMEGGGHDGVGRAVPMLHVLGDSEMPADPLVFVDHVTLKNAKGAAVRTERGAAFVPGSKDLVVTGSASAPGWFPVEIEEHTIDTLPAGTYTGNSIDEILLELGGTRMAGAGLSVDATLHERGVPYHVGRSSNDNFIVGSGEDGTLATLTIEAGVKLKMHPGTAFKVQHWTKNTPSSGALRVLGTPEKPVVFTSAAAVPAPGDWMGLWFGGIPSEKNEIVNARIEYAGHDCGCILNTCSAITQHEGAVIFTAQPPRGFIKNTVFSQIAGHGVTEGYDGAAVDFLSSNTFEGVTGCTQTRPRNTDTTCPSPKPACM